MSRDDLENGMLYGKEDEGTVLKRCAWCDAPIYNGDTYYEITDDDAVCEDCIRSARKTAWE